MPDLLQVPKQGICKNKGWAYLPGADGAYACKGRGPDPRAEGEEGRNDLRTKGRELVVPRQPRPEGRERAGLPNRRPYTPGVKAKGRSGRSARGTGPAAAAAGKTTTGHGSAEIEEEQDKTSSAKGRQNQRDVRRAQRQPGETPKGR